MNDKKEREAHRTPPPIPDKITYPFYDAPWWLEYSRWVREQKGWQCDECGISLKDNYEMLHTHHVNGINRNTLKNLQALCIGCHAEQPGKNHCQLKERRTYKRFMEKYGFVEDPVRLGNRTYRAWGGKVWRSGCGDMGYEISGLTQI